MECGTMNEDKASLDLARSSHYGLLREQLLDLQVLVKLPGEAKAISALYALATFVQGKRRFPRKSELDEVLSDILDRNLGAEEFRSKWQLNLHDDLAVDDPEKYYQETLEKLEILRRRQEGWGAWIDGK
jgi:hypothetical protein